MNSSWTISKTFLIKTLVRSMFFLLLYVVFVRPEKTIESSHRHHHGHDHDESDIDTPPKTEPIPLEEDPLEGLIQDIENILDGQPTQHQSAADEELLQDRLDLICTHYADLCGITSRESDYTLEEKYYYQILMIYMIRKIDSAREIATPESLRETLTAIRLQSNSTWRRWSASSHYVKMNPAKIDSYREFWEVFAHEVGWHIHDLWVLDDPYSSRVHPEYTEFGQAKFGLQDWSIRFYEISRLDENTRRSDSSFEDFVSWYAMKNIFEEFAEFTNAWINHHDLLRSLADKNPKIQQKYELFQELFGDRYFDADTSSLANFDDSQRVFDTTKPWKNK